MSSEKASNWEVDDAIDAVVRRRTSSRSKGDDGVEVSRIRAVDACDEVHNADVDVARVVVGVAMSAAAPRGGVVSTSKI